MLATAACPGGFRLPIEDDDAGGADSGAHEAAVPRDARPPTGGSGGSAEASDLDVVGDMSDPSCSACGAYGDVMQRGAIPSRVNELSGLAASHLHPGTLYAHNDS